MPIDSSNFSKIVKIYQENIDSLIENMGKEVVLYFEPKITNVNDQFYDPVRGGDEKRPSYKGNSSKVSPTILQATKIIKALTKLNPSDYETFGLVIKNPQGIVRLKTYISDVPDLKRCKYIIPNIDVKDIIGARYQLLRDPVPQGLQQDRYAISFWERV